jgi:hypothetical protein
VDVKIVEWNPGERMPKEFALGVINEMMCFCRRLYYQPKIKPFSTSIDFESRMQALNGLKEMIESSVTE